MSEDFRDPASGDAGIAVPPSVGSQLKAAREAKQMSVGEIALALKLGARQVDALESGDWDKLPGHTFIRGFVRNYARLLQTDPAPLMEQLDGVLVSPQQRLTLPGQKRHVTMPYQGRTRRRDYAMAFVGVALVAIAAAVYFLWPTDFSSVRGDIESLLAVFTKKEPAVASAPAAVKDQPGTPAVPEQVFPPGTTPQQVMNPQSVAASEAVGASPTATAPSTLVPPPVQAAPQPGTPTPTVAPPVSPSAVPAPQPVSPATSPAAPAASVPSPTPAEKAAAAEAGLLFSFVQDSWIEVRDRNGKVIASQLGRAGTEQSIAGQGPFTLVIGNAPGVKLSLRGKAVDLATRTQGNVARLTLE